MNEFVAKKMGEVHAFSVVGQTIFEKGKDALSVVLPNGYQDLAIALASQEKALIDIARSNGDASVTETKSAKTTEKLMAMMDMYVGDQWDNAAELLEWLGFFEGAAIVHWKLVFGAANALEIKPLIDLSSDAIAFHTNLLNEVSSAIETYAAKKVS